MFHYLWQWQKCFFNTHWIPSSTRPTPLADLVTHDELTFYENDWRKMHWINDNVKAVAEKKGEGQSIMASMSDFLTSEWGWLKDGDEWECLSAILTPVNWPFKTVKLVCSSKQGRTETGTLMQMTCFNKLITPLIFLKQRQIDLQLAFFCLITPWAIRDEHWMLSQHERCQKIPMQCWREGWSPRGSYKRLSYHHRWGKRTNERQRKMLYNVYLTRKCVNMCEQSETN